MYITTHCYLEGAKIKSSPIKFKLKNREVVVKNIPEMGSTKEGMQIEIKLPVDIKELKIPNEVMDKKGKFIDKRLTRFKSMLQETSFLLEGLLSIYFNVKIPAFNTGKVVVNVYAENKEEANMLKEGTVTGGFGDVFYSEKKFIFPLDKHILSKAEIALSHLPSLSFFTQARRSFESGNHEIAFYLYFKIIEGYFGDGTPKIQNALLENKKQIAKYIKIDQQLTTALKKILNELLSLPSESANSNTIEAVIKDLVLIRHKLNHFSINNSEKYFHPELRFHLEQINRYLGRATLVLLFDQMNLIKK